jgi:hypothetical protein
MFYLSDFANTVVKEHYRKGKLVKKHDRKKKVMLGFGAGLLGLGLLALRRGKKFNTLPKQESVIPVVKEKAKVLKTEFILIPKEKRLPRYTDTKIDNLEFNSKNTQIMRADMELDYHFIKTDIDKEIVRYTSDIWRKLQLSDTPLNTTTVFDLHLKNGEVKRIIHSQVPNKIHPVDPFGRKMTESILTILPPEIGLQNIPRNWAEQVIDLDRAGKQVRIIKTPKLKSEFLQQNEIKDRGSYSF